MPYFFQQSCFFTTVAALDDLPKSSKAEIAFVGRSNSGKSSAINALTNQKQLAFMSKMPGRTQHLNFFDILRHKESVGFLVDLPGYGYAKTTKKISKNWEGFLGDYLVTRSQLVGLVLIMDCRHPFTELDYTMIKWFAQTNKPMYILLNKCDKLGNMVQMQTLHICQKKIQELDLAENQINNIQIQLFSSSKKKGILELSQHLQTWLTIFNAL
jgi:GTP-binding protein